MAERLIMEETLPAKVLPFNASEWAEKKGKFVDDDLPRLIATLESLARQLQAEKVNNQNYIRLLAGLVKRSAVPLGPITCALRKATLDALPKGFNLHIEEHPEEIRFLVQGKIITP